VKSRMSDAEAEQKLFYVWSVNQVLHLESHGWTPALFFTTIYAWSGILGNEPSTFWLESPKRLGPDVLPLTPIPHCDKTLDFGISLVDMFVPC